MKDMFQFLIVRLKFNREKSDFHFSSFQFLIVRLKSSNPSNCKFTVTGFNSL